MKIKILILGLIILSGGKILAASDCWIHYKVAPGQGYWFYYEKGRHCTYGGTDCIIKQCNQEPRLGSIEPLPTGCWLLYGTFDGTILQREDDNQWVDFFREGSFYTFLPPEKLVIDNCSTYPQLENIQLELSGITTDAYGNFTIYVPPIQ